MADLNGRRALARYVRMLIEMPHVDLGDEHVELHRGKRLIIIDFRIEHLPLPMAERTALLRAFHTTGIIADVKDRSFVFSASSPVRQANDQDLNELPHLPAGWLDNAKFFEE